MSDSGAPTPRDEADVSFVNDHIGEIYDLKINKSHDKTGALDAFVHRNGKKQKKKEILEEDDYSIAFDSVMEEIKKNVWEQVRRARVKVHKPRGAKVDLNVPYALSNGGYKQNGRPDPPVSDDEASCQSEPVEELIEEDNDGKISQQSPTDSEEPVSTIVNMTDELILDDDMPSSNNAKNASARAVRHSLSKTPRDYTKHPCSDSDMSSTRAVGPSNESTLSSKSPPIRLSSPKPKPNTKSTLTSAPSDEFWDSQDVLINLFANASDTAAIDMENAVVSDIMARSESVQKMQDAEVDSIFDSILAIELETKQAQKKPIRLEKVEPEERRKQSQNSSSRQMPGPLDRISSRSVLRANIHGSVESTTLYMPISYMKKREEEMKERALDIGIPENEWSGSYLCQRILASQETEIQMITLDLYPESECAEANYSQSFEWQSWLNICIESFYKTGLMKIPDFCVGPDLLVALQYFGILYRPEQLLFESVSTYLRVKLWSEYFTFRGTIAAWLTRKLYQSRGKHTHIFSTCPNPIEKGSFVTVENQNVDVFDGGISLNPHLCENATSCNVLYNFFNESMDGNDYPCHMDAMMRRDFCQFFSKLVPGIDARFPKRATMIQYDNGKSETLHLATLYLRLKNPNPSSGERSIRPEGMYGLGLETAQSLPSRVARPLVHVLASCQIHQRTAARFCLDPPASNARTFEYCLDPPAENARPSAWEKVETWLPVQDPEAVSAFSLNQCRNLNGWMSTSETEEPKPDLGMFNEDEEATTTWWDFESVSTAAPFLPAAQVPRSFEPVETLRRPERELRSLADSVVTSSTGTSTLVGPHQAKLPFPEVTPQATPQATFQVEPLMEELRVDHIYEDLWLHDAAFDAAWDRKVGTAQLRTYQTSADAENNIGLSRPTTASAPPTAHMKSKKKKQSNSKSAQQKIQDEYKKIQTSKQKRRGHRPNNFVCEAEEVFKGSVGFQKTSQQQQGVVVPKTQVAGIDYPEDEEKF